MSSSPNKLLFQITIILLIKSCFLNETSESKPIPVQNIINIQDNRTSQPILKKEQSIFLMPGQTSIHEKGTSQIELLYFLQIYYSVYLVKQAIYPVNQHNQTTKMEAKIETLLIECNETPLTGPLRCTKLTEINDEVS